MSGLTDDKIKQAVQKLLDALDMPTTDTNYIERMQKKTAARKAGEDVIAELELVE